MFYFDFPIQIQAFLNQCWIAINYLLFFILFLLIYITYKKPTTACGLLIILFPTYLFRTKIFGIPTTFLELSFLTILLSHIVKNYKNWKLVPKAFGIGNWKFPLLPPIILLIIAATISILISPNKISALGLWKAYFIEPILLFFLLINTVKTEKEKEFIIWCLGISTFPIALLAIYQKFTGWGIAEPMWVGESARRVTAIFTSPNAVGLYLGPIAVLYFGWLIVRIKKQESRIKNMFIFFIFILMMLAIIYTKSQGAYLGILAGVVFLCYFFINGAPRTDVRGTFQCPGGATIPYHPAVAGLVLG